MELSANILTFGKYKNKSLDVVLKDRSYCKWFLEQPEFKIKYEYIYNKINEYRPRIYFIPPIPSEAPTFIENYIYFNLTKLEDVSLPLNDEEKKCYEFYILMIEELKNKIITRIENNEENPYNIKAPTKWLQRFESDTGLQRDTFKTFINSYELPNIPYVIEDIKKQGGIVYNGANSFTIAKERSKSQEKFWEEILKEKYGEDLGVQFQYEKCIFDFINISTNTLFECKLNIKDFDEPQYNKYLLTMGSYKILYLIDRDCVINILEKSLYTTDTVKYLLYKTKIPTFKKQNAFFEMLATFEIKETVDIKNNI